MTLVSPEALALELGDPELRIADVRWTLNQPTKGLESFEAGHLPGAVFVDLDTDLSDHSIVARGRHPLPRPAAFTRRMGELGFGSAHHIVVYDDVGGTIAARLWWMLDDLGHGDVRLLDGGIGAWQAAGLPMTTEVATPTPATMRLPRTEWTGVIDREGLAGRLGEATLLDLRAGERYRGEVEPVDPVAGHIPTAVSAPSTGNLGADGRFLSPDALATRYGELRSGDRRIVYCGSGVTACHGALALRIAGLDAPLLYGGSYSDWSSAGLPVAAGSEPGTAPR